MIKRYKITAEDGGWIETDVCLLGAWVRYKDYLKEKSGNLPEANRNAVLADVLALIRHNPTSSGHYGYGYMCEDKNGEWVNREELLEILSKYFS